MNRTNSTPGRPSSVARGSIAAGAVAVSVAALWTSWLVTELAGPLTASGHHDFLALYAAATLVHTGSASHLYDASSITAIERAIYPHPTGYAGYMPFLNPPAAAALLSPLALLTETSARFLWLGVALLVAGLGIASVIRQRTSWIVVGSVILVLLFTFPAYQTLVEGQWSYVMVLGSLLALRLSDAGRQEWAGIALVVLWLKPPLFALVLLWLLCNRRWRMAGAAVAAVAVVTLAALPWTGVDANLHYFSYLLNVSATNAAGGGAAGATAWEGSFANMEGLLGLAAAIVGQNHPVAVDILTLVLAAGVAGVLVWSMRGHWGRPLPLRLGVAALLVGLLLDPHLYAQDCLLLVVPAALVAWRLQLGAGWWFAVAAVMNLAAIDTLWSQQLFPLPLHLLTIAMVATVFVLCLPAPWFFRQMDNLRPAAA